MLPSAQSSTERNPTSIFLALKTFLMRLDHLRQIAISHSLVGYSENSQQRQPETLFLTPSRRDTNRWVGQVAHQYYYFKSFCVCEATYQLNKCSGAWQKLKEYKLIKVGSRRLQH